MVGGDQITLNCNNNSYFVRETLKKTVTLFKMALHMNKMKQKRLEI